MTEITYFQYFVFVNENIEWLEVSVDDTPRVNVEQTLANLIRKELDMTNLQRILIVFYHVRKVLSAILEDKV